MRKIAILCLALGAVSLVVGVISRITMTPVPIAPCGIIAETFLMFTNTCILAAIALLILEKK